MPKLPLIVLTASAATAALVSVAMGQTTQPATPIELGAEAQTITSFGASGAWWAQGVGDWDESVRSEILDLLYTDEGAGMDLYRYNVGGAPGTPFMPPEDRISDPWRRGYSVEVSPGEYDFSRDAAALRVLEGIRERGVEQFVLFANSPPAELTISGMTSGGENGSPNLPEENEDAFAERFVDTCVALANEFDLPHVVLSPINEPNVAWGTRRHQEGCSYEPEQVARVMAKVAGVMELRGLDRDRFELDGPESTTWSDRRLFRTLLERRNEDPTLAKWMSQLATHSYGGNRRDRRQLVAMRDELAPGLPIAMTEWTEMQRGRDGSMETALTMASTMHDDLNIGQAVTWQKWIAASKYEWRDGLIYLNADQSYDITKRLWAMAHFARFVPPGSTRVEVDVEGVGASVFTTPEGETVFVMTNRAEEAKAFELPPGSAEAFVTDADRDLAELSMTDAVVEVPALSIVTVVLTEK